MIEKEDLTRLLEYTVWANHRLLRVAAVLSVDDFKRDLGSSYGSVRGTLTHVMSAEWIWLERWKGVSPKQVIDEGDFPDPIALRDRWVVLEEHRRGWFEALTPSAVHDVVRYTTLKGEAYEAPLWKLVQHVANHSTYHRGQLVTLFRQLGAKPVSTDLLVWDLNRDGPWGGSSQGPR